MAFSMFLKKTACPTRLFGQQIAKIMISQPNIIQRSIQSSTVISTKLFANNSNSILNSVRSLKTSAVRLSGEHPHNHAKLWVVEKAVAAALVVILPLALIIPNKYFDSLLAIGITAHSFWGLEAIAVDYVRASIFGPVIPKIALAFVYLISIATLGGLFYIIQHDEGIARLVRRFWAIKSDAHKA